MAKAIPSPELSLASGESRGQRLKEQRALGCELWKLPEDIVAIRGPPDELFPVEPAPEDDGDGWDRVERDWAA